MKKTSKIRIFAILQLCIVFTVLLSNAGAPFMGELLAYRTRALVYREVMGDQTLAAAVGVEEERQQLEKVLERNRARFLALPENQQQQILTNYTAWQSLANQSFLQKLKRSWDILAFELSPFKRAWILFSIVIPILILLRREGALQTAWLLPLLAIGYALFPIASEDRARQAEIALYPTEEALVSKYLNAPLSPEIMTQYKQLKTGWQHYLAEEWAAPSPHFTEQVEEGSFAFNLERLAIWTRYPELPPLNQPVGNLGLLLYIGWNAVFAWICIWEEKTVLVQMNS